MSGNRDMKERICNIIWWCFLALLVFFTVGIPTLAIGMGGFFFGMGVIFTGTMLLYLADCTMGYVKHGKFKPVEDQA